MKVKTIINISSGLVALGGASAGTYYALNSKTTKSKDNTNNQKETPTPAKEIKKPNNVRLSLISKGLTPLDTKETNGNKQQWENLIKKFIDGGLREDQKIKAVIARTSTPDKDGPTNMANIKKACDELFEKPEENNPDFSKNEEIAKNWCTAQSELLKEVPPVGAPGAVSPA